MMKKFINPDRKLWEKIAARPELKKTALDSIVAEIINDVKLNGDRAVKKYSFEFDGVSPDNLRVSGKEIDEAVTKVDSDLRNAISKAKDNIERFHASQLSENPPIETVPGVKCWQRNIPVEKVGLYIPGGTAPLFSTVLMLAVPARIAGCNRIIMCTPPARNGEINPVLLYTAALSGVTEIYKTGGAQAIAAMAFGTETIPAVYKIFGPGNQYVTRAKQLVQLDGTAIDMPAGPSEVLIIGDEFSDAGFIASDLLSQAEHGSDSQVVLLSDSSRLIEKVERELDTQLKDLPRRKTASDALSNSFAIVLASVNECMEFSNQYAPEHLIISTHNSAELAGKVINAGSVFIGKYSCESAGDYASGTNHTLPTNGFARSYSGVSTDSFMKKISFQEISAEGLANIGRTITLMADAEYLEAHSRAVTIRLNSIADEQN
jgi:histidinol dehydrogenase